MHGYDTYDYVARGMYPAIMSFTSVDPHAENYYNLSPYAYCGGNPVNRIDPYGMDYWTTSDPVEIARFLNSLFQSHTGMLDFYSNSFNFSSWDHLTDAEFTDRLTFNDKDNTFYFSYSKVINGEFTVIGVSVKATNTSDGNAWTQYGHPASGMIEQDNILFDLLLGGTNVGWTAIKGIFSRGNSYSTTNTFNANSNIGIDNLGKNSKNYLTKS